MWTTYVSLKIHILRLIFTIFDKMFDFYERSWIRMLISNENSLRMEWNSAGWLSHLFHTVFKKNFFFYISLDEFLDFHISNQGKQHFILRYNVYSLSYGVERIRNLIYTYLEHSILREQKNSIHSSKEFEIDYNPIESFNLKYFSLNWPFFQDFQKKLCFIGNHSFRNVTRFKYITKFQLK